MTKKTFRLAILLVLPFFLLAGFRTFPVQASMQISAGSLNYQEDWIDLKDGVTIFWQDLEITSRYGEIDRENSIAYLYEDIEMLMERGHIRSLKMTIYLDDEDILFEEEVELTLEEDEDNEPLNLTAPRLLYNAERESYEMDSGLTIYQGGRTITSEEGDYREEEGIFYLRRQVEIVEENGDRITSDRAEIDMEDGQVFTAEGNVSIELKL